MTRRRQTIASIGLSVVVIAVMLLLAVNSATAVVPERGGAFVEASSGVVTTLNPLLSPGRGPDEDLVRLLFAGLTRTDDQGGLVPDLAARWEVSGDGRTYAFLLRPNLRWHDGTPLTARDVVFTAKLLRDDAFPGRSDVAEPWRKVTAEWIDDSTVRFHLPAPDAQFLAATSLGIVPAHLLEGWDVAALARHPTNSKPVGNGPFRFVSGTLDEVVLQSFPDYHLGQPFLDRVRFRFYPDVEQARRAVLQGEADGFGSFLPEPKPAENAPTVLLSASTTNLALIELNVGHPVLADPQVRQALSIGLDRQELVRTALKDWGEPSLSLYPKDSWIRDRSARDSPATADQARALIERAGWRAGGDGIRSKNGQRMTLTLLTTRAGDRRALASGIAEQWRSLGVEANVAVSDTLALVKDALTTSQYSAALIGVDLGLNPNVSVLFHSGQAHGAGFNFSGYGQPDLDQLLDRVQQVPARDQRARAFRDVDSRIRTEAPAIPVAFARYGYLVSRDVRGVALGLVESPADRFRNVHEWHFRTKRILVRPGEGVAIARS